jgi:hypothetical protein
MYKIWKQFSEYWSPNFEIYFQIKYAKLCNGRIYIHIFIYNIFGKKFFHNKRFKEVIIFLDFVHRLMF